ncbi:MAG: A/G-specific adenine glycosylase [Gammaproteobacteria bacterium]
MSPADFQRQLLSWFDQYGRKNLPWQQGITPYRVWISEIMLQQTQVVTVIPYFNAFVERFAHVEDLAKAPVDEVLHLWSGLGYYSRARNLHKAAQCIVEKGHFPDNLHDLLQLPGIGRSTAGAILSIAFNQSHPILDGNVRRVLSRFKGLSGWHADAAVNKRLWAASMDFTPFFRVADYTQAIMDLGATVCTRTKPACTACPLSSACFAYKHDRIAVLPTPRPARVKPVRRCVFLLLSAKDSRILLEKRPAAGIWGGLWSLPEFSTIEAALSWCSSTGVNIADQHLLPEKRHSFSHYHLDFTPLHVRTDSPVENLIMEAGQTIWYKAERSRNMGLAAPIKHLLTLVDE